jgi:hypothetical protein
VHQRVLRYDREDGFEWALAVWEDPGGPKALHDQVGRLVEATLLSALCRPPSERDAVDAQPRAIWLLAFARVADAPRALRAFGFAEVTPDPEWVTERMGSLRTEAQAASRSRRRRSRSTGPRSRTPLAWWATSCARCRRS